MRSSYFLRGMWLSIVFVVGAASAVAASHEEPSRHAPAAKRVIPSSPSVAAASERTSTAMQVGALVPDSLLVARFDGASSPLPLKPGMVAATYFDESVMYTESAEAATPVRYGLGFSKPGRWTSVVTALALCVFFIVRRMV